MPPGMSPGGLPPEIQTAIDQAVQTAMGSTGGDAATGGVSASPARAGGAKKLDPVMIYLEMGRIRKLLTNMHQHLNLPLPEDILDDNMVAQAVSGMGVQSAPIGAEGGAVAAPPPPAAGAGGTIPGIGTSPPIAPPEIPKTAAAIVMGSPVPQEATPATQADEAATQIERIAYLSRSLRNNGS